MARTVQWYKGDSKYNYYTDHNGAKFRVPRDVSVQDVVKPGSGYGARRNTHREVDDTVHEGVVRDRYRNEQTAEELPVQAQEATNRQRAEDYNTRQADREAARQESISADDPRQQALNWLRTFMQEPDGGYDAGTIQAAMGALKKDPSLIQSAFPEPDRERTPLQHPLYNVDSSGKPTTVKPPVRPGVTDDDPDTPDTPTGGNSIEDILNALFKDPRWLEQFPDKGEDTGEEDTSFFGALNKLFGTDNNMEALMMWNMFGGNRGGGIPMSALGGQWGQMGGGYGLGQGLFGSAGTNTYNHMQNSGNAQYNRAFSHNNAYSPTYHTPTYGYNTFGSGVV